MGESLRNFIFPGTGVRIEYANILKQVHSGLAAQSINEYKDANQRNKGRGDPGSVKIDRHTGQRVIEMGDFNNQPEAKTNLMAGNEIQKHMDVLDGSHMEAVRVVATIADIASIVVPTFLGITVARQINGSDFIANAAGVLALGVAKVPANGAARFVTTLFAQNILSGDLPH